MDQVEQLQLELRGALTSLAQAAERLAVITASFEQRGGHPVFGDDALLMVYVSNDLQGFLTPARRATIAKFRTDV